MLSELHIHNFAVIEDAHLQFDQGFTILSGDEGAGKSLVVDALNLLLGARASTGLIRTGTSNAKVEGIFWLSPDQVTNLNQILQDSAVEIEPDGMLAISRDLQEQGRSVTRLNSRVVPLSVLRQMGQYLIDVHSQMENLSVTDSRRQLELIDVYGNLMELRGRVAERIDALRRKSAELDALDTVEKTGRQELLQYQVEEIDRAQLNSGEDEALKSQRDILYRAAALKEGCMNVYNSLYGGEPSATELAQQALISLKNLGAIDKSLLAHTENLESVVADFEDIAREINRYIETIESNAERLNEIEQRLDIIASLKQKYGRTIEDVIAYGDRLRAELNDLENKQELRNRLEEERNVLEKEAGKLAEELSSLRHTSSISLSKLVNVELADLGLPNATFDIVIRRREDAKGLPVSDGKRFDFTRDGIDAIEFQVVTNPGEPLKPLSMIASGGETCRIILALKSALKRADPIPTLVFDEIDIGVGGRSGDTVGKKLASLARYHQVLCITHLPQIACFGDHHMRVAKEVSSGRASTKVVMIEGKDKVDELAAMLGSQGDAKSMVSGAQDLLQKAEAWKKSAEK